MSQRKKMLLAGAGLFVLLIAVYFTMQATGDIIFARAVVSLFSNLWWIILPIPMAIIFNYTWLEYCDFTSSLKKESVFLEIFPPQDVERSPRIMEQVFSGLHTWSTPNKFEEHCGWRMSQDEFSFEIVSTEGTVHFYAKCPKATRNNLESQIYAQYPDAEIFEIEDYTKNIPKNLPNKQWDLWGSVMELVRPDPVPIRTYKHFQEDVTKTMIDPLASLTEVMGAIGKGQHIWFQVIFSPEAEKNWVPKSEDYLKELTGQETSNSKVKRGNPIADFFREWAYVARNVIRGIFTDDLEFPEGEEAGQEEKKEFNLQRLTPGMQERVKAVEDNMSKVAFITVIRLVYIGKRDVFNKALGVAGPMGALKQFSDINLNAIKTDNKTKTFANYYLTDPRLEWRKRRIMERYRGRSKSQGSFIFNTEELATIFHFPDMSVAAPGIQRIEAKKSDAPLDLPVEFEPS